MLRLFRGTECNSKNQAIRRIAVGWVLKNYVDEKQEVVKRLTYPVVIECTKLRLGADTPEKEQQ